MIEKHKGMEPLPGFLDINTELEQQHPGLRDIFDGFLHELKAPRDVYEDLISARDEFPIQAAIALPNSKGRLKIVAASKNHTKSEHGSLGHAETLAIKGALNGEKHLPGGAVLVSTVEPCAMCIAGLHHSGGSQVIFGASQSDIRGATALVDGRAKPFRSEPDGYSAREFLLARDPVATVVGGYRRQEVLQLN